MKANDVTNNVANTAAIDNLNQEHQDYYDRWDQQSIPQYIGCKYNGDLELITLELVPDIILEEEEERFSSMGGPL